MRPQLGTMITTIATVGVLGIAGVTAAAIASPGSSTNLNSPTAATAAASASPTGGTTRPKTPGQDKDWPGRDRPDPGWADPDRPDPGWADPDRPDPGWADPGHGAWADAPALHGEATVRTDKGYQVIAGQRGTPTRVSATSITVTSEDGYQATYTVTGGTALWSNGNKAKIGDFTTGTTVLVAATVDGATRTARVIAHLPTS